ncbi:helix-turn-helix transcriptional regulator [Bradyrhizobium sp.]|uniref:helix-turn-helix transcriptional regulator n=1 Tax=Bradyrhizobium sp. TaxID=376 RepID=UPI003C6B1749
MRMDTPLANDPTLAALIPEGVALAHIISLFQTAYHVNWEQLLRARLGATHPANLAPAELAEFIKYMLGALKSAGIRDPADVLAYGVRREAEAAAAKLKSSAAIGDLAAERKSDGHAPVTIENNSSTISDASAPRPVAQIIAYGTTKAEDERQSDKPATNTAPPTIANPQASTPATGTAGDEIVIDDRHLLGERRVAEMLGCSLRTLQRSRTKGKGPASTKIGRKVFYELNDLREWIDRGKIR